MSDWQSVPGDMDDFAAWVVGRADAWQDQDDDVISFTAAAGEVIAGSCLEPELIVKLSRMVGMFAAARAKARWERTGEPPTLVTVEVKITAA